MTGWRRVKIRNMVLLLMIGILLGNIAGSINATPGTVHGQPQQGGTLRVAYQADNRETNPVLKPWSGFFIPFTTITIA